MNKEFENVSHGIYTKKDSGIDELLFFTKDAQMLCFLMMRHFIIMI